MKLVVTGVLPASAERTWALERSLDWFRTASLPVLGFEIVSPDPPPAAWEAGLALTVRPVLLPGLAGGIRLGAHRIRTLTVDAEDPAVRRVVTEESGGAVTRMTHSAEVIEIASDTARCRHSDALEIEADWRVPLLWAGTQALYRYRLMRMRRRLRRQGRAATKI